MINYEYFSLEHKEHSGIVLLKWLESSSEMYESDFVEHILVLNNFVKAYNARVLIIDATNFRIKHGNPCISRMKYIDKNTSLKWILYTSKNRKMRCLLQSLESSTLNVLEYEAREQLFEFYE